jgi:hypothetical protein
MRAFVCWLLLACSGAEDPNLDAGSGDASSDVKIDTAKPDAGVDSSGGMDFTSSPGEIPCGNITCNAQPFACCLTRNGTMSMVSCTDPGTCPTGAMSAELDCNEAADCPMGQVCCKNGALTQCVSSCMGTQICTKNAECTSGGCRTYSCPVEGTVHACGLPMGCK